MHYGNPTDIIKVGDRIRLHRRYSHLNGFSIREDWDRDIVTVIEVEDRINGGISFVKDDGQRGFCFQDAFGGIIK